MRPGEKVMRDFPCDHCGARSGEPCRSKSGRHVVNSHAHRYYAACDVGRLPLPDVTARGEVRT